MVQRAAIKATLTAGSPTSCYLVAQNNSTFVVSARANYTLPAGALHGGIVKAGLDITIPPGYIGFISKTGPGSWIYNPKILPSGLNIDVELGNGFNLDPVTDYDITAGDKIGQLVILPVEVFPVTRI